MARLLAYLVMGFLGFMGLMSGEAEAANSLIKGVGSGRCIDIPGNSKDNSVQATIWDCHKGSNQQFNLTDRGEIRVRHSGKCLDVAGANKKNGAAVQQFECNGTDAQRWIVTAVGNIKSKLNGKCIDVKGRGTENGSVLQMWDCHRGDNQTWTHELTGTVETLGYDPSPAPEKNALNSGTFVNLMPGRDPATGRVQCVTLKEWSTDEGAEFTYVPCDGYSRADFHYSADQQLISRYSGKCLQVDDRHAAWGQSVRVKQATCNNSKYQKWMLEGDDYGLGKIKIYADATRCLEAVDGQLIARGCVQKGNHATNKEFYPTQNGWDLKALQLAEEKAGQEREGELARMAAVSSTREQYKSYLKDIWTIDQRNKFLLEYPDAYRLLAKGYAGYVELLAVMEAAATKEVIEEVRQAKRNKELTMKALQKTSSFIKKQLENRAEELAKQGFKQASLKLSATIEGAATFAKILKPFLTEFLRDGGKTMFQAFGANGNIRVGDPRLGIRFFDNNGCRGTQVGAANLEMPMTPIGSFDSVDFNIKTEFSLTEAQGRVYYKTDIDRIVEGIQVINAHKFEAAYFPPNLFNDAARSMEIDLSKWPDKEAKILIADSPINNAPNNFLEAITRFGDTQPPLIPGPHFLYDHTYDQVWGDDFTIVTNPRGLKKGKICIDTFEKTREVKGLNVTYLGQNGLDGKVSSVMVVDNTTLKEFDKKFFEQAHRRLLPGDIVMYGSDNCQGDIVNTASINAPGLHKPGSNDKIRSVRFLPDAKPAAIYFFDQRLDVKSHERRQDDWGFVAMDDPKKRSGGSPLGYCFKSLNNNQWETDGRGRRNPYFGQAWWWHQNKTSESSLAGKISSYQVVDLKSVRDEKVPDLVFFEGNKCSQNVTGTFSSLENLEKNCKSSDRCPNDEARSMLVHSWANPFQMSVWDSPDGKSDDDITHIYKFDAGENRSVCLNSFEQTNGFEVDGKGNLKRQGLAVNYVRDNGLDGKISRVKVTAGAPRQVEFPNDLIFYSGNNCGGNVVGALNSRKAQQVNCQKSGSCKNDDARSLKIMPWARPARISVYDSPSASRGDDFSHVYYRKYRSPGAGPVCVNSFERAWWPSNHKGELKSATDLAVIHMPKNGLDGKISNIHVDPNEANPGVPWEPDILLYEGNNCSQDIVGQFKSRERVSVNCKKDNRCPNDEARSILLQPWASPSEVKVYDHPDGKTSDDWWHGYVANFDGPVCFSTFQKTSKRGYADGYFHKKNGLDGKVSRINVHPK
ncbi:MAG: ricin-type beta-trefoil lectin domain protein [Sneathiella sp.]|nr:ricin-type beta-trefoil lectin domain protein [Sneathiella sp.]